MRDDSLPIVETQVNGHAVPSVLDTGLQPATSLDKKTLEGFGVTVRSVESTYAGVDVMTALMDHIALGPTEYKKTWFVVNDLEEEGVGAKIGANFLFRTDVEIALADRYLKFFKPSGCFRAKLAYWDATAPSVPFTVHPLKKDMRPWFKVSINGKEIKAVISTASPHSYMDLFTAQRMGLSTELAGAQRLAPFEGWFGRKQEVWRVPVPEMSIGDLKLKDVDMRLLNLDLSGETLILGVDFLRQHRVYVAMSQNRIYFSPVNPKPSPTVPAQAGRDAQAH
jgi:predicted aspartyl protease